MNSDNDWFFDKFDQNFNRAAKGIGCLWLIGALMSTLVSLAIIIGVVVIIMHVT